MFSYTFLWPHFFWLLLIIPFFIAWYVWKQKEMHASLKISSLKGFSFAPKSKRVPFRHSLIAFRVLALVCLICVLARPQSSNSFRDEVTEGIDIVMALDISSSMLAEDFKPNRLEAAKEA